MCLEFLLSVQLSMRESVMCRVPYKKSSIRGQGRMTSLISYAFHPGWMCKGLTSLNKRVRVDVPLMPDLLLPCSAACISLGCFRLLLLTAEGQKLFFFSFLMVSCIRAWPAFAKSVFDLTNQYLKHATLRSSAHSGSKHSIHWEEVALASSFPVELWCASRV